MKRFKFTRGAKGHAGFVRHGLLCKKCAIRETTLNGHPIERQTIRSGKFSTVDVRKS